MIDDGMNAMTRREAAKVVGSAGVVLLLPAGAACAASANESVGMLARPIPSSGEKLPVIGLGTWQTFDVEPAQSGPLAEVLRAFVKLGGRVIDSSPMYGRAEQVIGDLLTKLKLRDSVFLATQVWNRGQQAGIDYHEQSFSRYQNNTHG